jgi:hypothetical protein
VQTSFHTFYRQELEVHPEAYEGFGWALRESGLDPTKPYSILDVGGQDVNGTVHDYFPNAEILTLDLENADIIADATVWKPDQWFDVVIATEVFEHVAGWGYVLETMYRALDVTGPGVLLATCASTNRPAHGATGAPLPAPGEHYDNVSPYDLENTLELYFPHMGVRYQYPPGDAYMWGRIA